MLGEHGSSIDVYYTDGPPTKAVEGICNAHEGGRFDGMIDLAYHVRHVVYTDADGIERPMLVASDGTEGSRGSDPSYYAHPEDLPPGARPVSLGADYVFEHREYSAFAMRAAVHTPRPLLGPRASLVYGATLRGRRFDHSGQVPQGKVSGRSDGSPFFV